MLTVNQGVVQSEPWRPLHRQGKDVQRQEFQDGEAFPPDSGLAAKRLQPVVDKNRAKSNNNRTHQSGAGWDVSLPGVAALAVGSLLAS